MLILSLSSTNETGNGTTALLIPEGSELVDSGGNRLMDTISALSVNGYVSWIPQLGWGGWGGQVNELYSSQRSKCFSFLPFRFACRRACLVTNVPTDRGHAPHSVFR